MAVSTIVTTIGGATSNSYLTNTEADQYFEDRLDSSDWGSNEDDQNRALLMAAIRLNQEEWTGSKADSDQALQWPRFSTTDRDGFAIASNVIPISVKNAQAELALLMLKSDFFGASGLDAFKELIIGPLEIIPNNQTGDGEFSDVVWREIGHLLIVSSGSSFRIQKG